MRPELAEMANRFKQALGTQGSRPPPPEASAPVAKPEAAPAPKPAEEHEVRFEIAEKVRCDILCYSGRNCSGQLSLVHVTPDGKHKGKVKVAELSSVFIAGPIGTRLIFATSTGDDWQAHPWRAVRLIKGKSFKARNGKPAVKVMDLDTLDLPSAYRSDTEVQVSFPKVERLEDGDDWTFGRPGEIKGKVRVIYVDKE